ncbi:Early nodulin-like protein [Rhynchospora pubera]|uniref:Early nodulin-like protein n=1 Tax=Rhynchospora pubera TaxID=906938 RepID=A0AAV8HCU8_9POAL|nr:Early nodulin-like protein [Rhynchospora pubera]
MADAMKLVVLLAVVIVCGGSTVSAEELFMVGGSEGWAVPSEADFYHRWASDKIFQVGDILRFRYKHDSVLMVSREDYEKCYSADPILVYRGRNTHYELNRSGYYYFISGELEHCEQGQKLAIQVTSSDMNASPPPPPDPPLKPVFHCADSEVPLLCYSEFRASKYDEY